MADPRDLINQIEYRWQHEKDLSPFATTMSPPMTAGWNDIIRAWVRHPHAAGLSESVCYKIWDETGDAALAWRYQDPRAAHRTDGTSGRPHVSRVLVGHVSVLTPEVAIALCRMGLPSSARPHRVSAPGELPTISPDELTTAASKAAGELDHMAAQEAGLPELVAAALSDRDRPLAVYLPEHVIAGRLGDGPQGLLLWGLHRILGVVPGAGHRGWSFSTFELPLGPQDTTTLPDIVFRRTIRESAPPGIMREEVKAWPLEPDALADLRPQDLRQARRLVSGYAAHGVDGVERLLAEEDARREQTVRYGTSPKQHESDSHGDPDTGWSASTPREFIQAEPAAPDPVAREAIALQGLAMHMPQLPTLGPSLPVGHDGGQRDSPEQAELRESYEWQQPAAPVNPPAPASRAEQGQPAAQPRSRTEPAGRHSGHRDPLAANREDQTAPQMSMAGPVPQPWKRSATGDVQSDRDRAGQGGYWQPGRIDYLLRQMRDAPDASTLQAILQHIVVSRAEVGRNDRQEARVERQEARRVMSNDDWYDSVARSSGYMLTAAELAGIFQLIVIPDLGRSEDAVARVGRWADCGDREMICGLLMAARDAALKERTGLIARKSKNPVEQVRHIMLPRLASRWAEENGIAEWWDIDQLP